MRLKKTLISTTDEEAEALIAGALGNDMTRCVAFLKRREDGPERKCIATGEAQPKKRVIALLSGPDMHVSRIFRKLPGRGMYVSA